MLATYKANRRHKKLMKAAHHLLYSAFITPDLDAARAARGESTTRRTAT